MTTPLSPITVSRLEKAATDNGFDQELEPEGNWIIFASTQCPLRVWLGVFGDAVFLAAFSQQNLARALGEYGTPIAAPMPKGAVAGRTVPDVPALHRGSGVTVNVAMGTLLILRGAHHAGDQPRGVHRLRDVCDEHDSDLPFDEQQVLRADEAHGKPNEIAAISVEPGDG